MKQTLRKLKAPAIAAMLAMPLAAWGQVTEKDHFVTSGLSSKSNSYWFTVGLEGSKTYCAYNMTLQLPIGMKFETTGESSAKLSYKKYPGFYATDWDDNILHTVAGTVQDDPHFAKVICSSMQNDLFEKESGSLYDIYVTYNAWTKAGENTVTMTDLNLTSNEYDESAKKYVAVNNLSATDVNYGTINVPADNRQVTISISAENKIGTCILPFEYTTPDGVTAYEVESIDGNMLNLSPVEKMAAYTPYILYAPAGCTQTLTGTASAEAFPNPASAVVNNNGLCGVLEDTEVTSGYILQNKNNGDGPQFYRVGSTPFALRAGRCYLSVSAGQSLKVRFIDRDEDGITAPAAKHNDALYNLQGQRIDAPAQRGIYILNGKKIIK